ncbi:MAG: UbiA family prenyltransferase [Kyrpidia tusciae]|nr:UbiA-like polyprenyltransferase [Kyrpidia tusciae]MBE3551983.1 UbiA family prenyltransferase [Kyrpidia tusciae]
MNKLVLFLRLVKFEHTIFALPYAYLGMILAAYDHTRGLPTWWQVFWVTVAMVGARSAAMGLNRVIDRAIDARNPRTAQRELPRGLLSTLEVWVFIIVSLVVLGVAAWKLNPLCLELFPVAVVILVVYSYTKRFTWMSHFVLGIADGLAPLGGWLAVSGQFDLPAVVLAAAVATWIAAFDIIYACQDVDFDRENGLHSVPVRFGIRRGLWISRGLDAVSVGLFLSLLIWVPLGWLYAVGIAMVALLLIYEHRLVSPEDMTHIEKAFFTVNSYVALVAFVFTAGDVLWHVFR